MEFLINSTILGSVQCKLLYDNQGLPKDFEIIDLNPLFEKFTGFSKNDLLGNNTSFIYKLDCFQNFPNIFELDEIVQNQNVVEFEYFSKITLKNYKAKLYSNQKPYFTTLFIEDKNLTNYEYANKSIDSFLKSTILDNINDSIVSTDLDFKINYINHAAKKLYGYTLEEILGKKPDFFNAEPMSQVIQEELYSTVSKGEVYENVSINRRKNGTLFICEYKVMPVLDETGRFLAYVGLQRDITDRKKAEDEQTAILETSHDGYFVVDLSAKFMNVNSAYCKMIGYTKEEILGLKVSDIEAQEDMEEVEKHIQILKKNGYDRFVTKHRHKSGKILDVEVSVSLLKDYDKLVVFVRDISEKKKIEEALYYERNLFTAGPVFTVEWDPTETWPIRTISSNVQSILGYTQEELTHPDFRYSSLIHPEDLNRIVLEVSENISNHIDKYEQSYRLKCKDGEYRWFYDFTMLVRDSLGKLTKIRGYLYDQTNQKSVELSLDYERKRLAGIIEGTNVGIWEWNVQTGETIFNNQWANIIGYTLEELEPISIETWKRFSHPDDLRKNNEILQKHFSGEIDSYETETRMLHKNGEWIWVLDRGKVISWNQEGNPLLMFGTHQNITERKRYEEELRLSEEKLKTYIEASPLGIFAADYEGKYIDVNKAGEILLGYTKEELLQLSIKDILEPESFSLGMTIVEKSIKEGLGDGVCRVRRKDGTTFWLWIFSTNVNQQFMLAFCQDVTSRIDSDIKLKEISDLQKILMEISTNFINIPLEKTNEAINSALSLLGEFTKTDRAYIFIYDHENKVCNNTYEWCAEGISQEIENLQNVPIENIPDWIDLHFQGKPMIIPNVKDIPEEKEIRQILLDQGIQSLLALPMMDNETSIGFVGFDAVRNVHKFTEKEIHLLTLFGMMLVNIINRNYSNAELKASKEKAEKASLAKSEFLANMSHEIRTPLNGVIGFTELLKNTPLTIIQKQYVDNANVSGHTLLGIINDILDFSKIESGMMELEFIKTDLIELIEHCVDIIKFAASKKELEILLNLDSNMPRFVIVDPIRLKQILSNLVGNAVKFTEKGEIEIKIVYRQTNKNQGIYTFYVRDTGIGISESEKDKLFKAFSQADSSTTRKFGGTGLGLIISDMIAQKMGGKILLDSKVGEGTTFYFDLKLDTEDGSPRNINDIEFIKKCLIIDDNFNNKMILEQLLDSWNIECDLCENGLDGIKKIDHKNIYDLIICDYNMPYLDGLETITKIRRIYNPEQLPIILLHSTNDDTELHKRCDDLGISFCISKPVKRDQFFSCLASIKVPSIINKLENIITSDNIINKKDFPIISKKNLIILIAEDVPLNMILTRTLISKIIPNSIILEATDGKKALEKYNERKPDVILMDIQMPVLDGLETTRYIRKIERQTGVKTHIIALTAGALKEEMERCYEAGMDDFLTKPIDKNKLEMALKKIFSVSLN